MDKPPAMPPSQVTASERDVLLATKLHVPHLQPGFVPRARLVEGLDEGLARGLVLVCAPAGFGKTALLADWARRGKWPVAWLSLDAGDNDLARFWRHAATALDQPHPGIAQRVAPSFGSAAPPAFEGLVTALINELATQPGEADTVLVLDDYHLIDDQSVHASLMFLLDHRPPALHVLLASRVDPPLALARLRARGQLAELRAADLRFAADEAAALLREAVGRDLPDAAAAALTARTEGWGAGLQLAALSLRGHADVAAFVASFGGSQRFVLDYLTEEVLGQLTEQVRGFLIETSVLERLSGPLCDAVTGRTDSQATLEAIENAGLFVVPLDDVRGWWRYHQLFADLLRARLRQEQPDRLPALHHAAATWCEGHGLLDETIRHALSAGDPAWAARLIEQHFDALLRRAEGATVDRWVEALPAELVSARPRLRLIQAVWALVGGRGVEAESLLADAERALTTGGDEPNQPSVGRAASRVANVPAAIALTRAELARRRGDGRQMAALVYQAEAHLTKDDSALRIHVEWFAAVADWLRGRLVPAEHRLVGLVAECRAARERYLAVRCACDLGQVRRAQGRLDAALDAYQQALEIGTESGRPLPPAGVAQVRMSEVLYERDELDAALRRVTEGVGLCRQLAFSQPLANGLATLARIRQARADPAGALGALGEAEQVAAGPDMAGLLNLAPAQRARLLLAQGDVAAAARWTQQCGLGVDDVLSYPKEPEYLVLARVLLARDVSDRALGLLERLLAAATQQGRMGSVIEVRALQALALAARGDEPTALTALAEALRLACPEGYVRVFVDEGEPMAALLGRLVSAQRAEQAAAGVPLECLAGLLRAFDGRQETSRLGRNVPGLVEPLTGREREVLGLLAAGSSNQRIAEELVVTLDTVKKHVSHVLDKLGAANRTEAVARARQLGLIG